MADVSIVNEAVASTPEGYKVPGAQEIILKAVGCTINGAGAAGSFLPALQMLDPAGHVMWTSVNVSEAVAVGGTALVSWFLGGGLDQSASGSASAGGTISSLASPLGTLAIQNAGGPLASLDVAATGAVAGTYGDSLDVAQVTVNAEGQITSVSNVPIASGAGGGILQVSKVTLTSGDLTTASTTFLDATGLTTSMTTGAHRCLVILSVSGNNSTANDNVVVDLAVDGTRQGGTFGLQFLASGVGDTGSLGFTYLTSTLTATSHTFKIQWRVDAGTGKLWASSAAPAILTVLELGI